MCTVKSQTRNKHHFVILIFTALLTSCAARQSPEPVSGVPEGPAAQQALDPSMAALMQGLQYVREHPSSREDERIQRFLWLDQWLNVLQTKQRLTPELAQELWGDFTSFVKDEPPVSPSGLRKISEGSQTKLGKNVAHYYTYQGLLKERSLEDALKSLEIVEEDGVSDIYTKSQELLQLYKSKEFSDSRKIGVLLPLSGDLKPLADEVLSSIQIISSMAYANGVEFVIQDVGSSEADLLKAWDHLVNIEKVAVVMGPLTPRESEAIFERAEVSGVPVVSLAPKEGLEGFGKLGVLRDSSGFWFCRTSVLRGLVSCGHSCSDVLCLRWRKGVFEHGSRVDWIDVFHLSSGDCLTALVGVRFVDEGHHDFFVKLG
jgi:hypothetical protein